MPTANSAVTVSPAAVVVAPMVLTMTSWLVSDGEVLDETLQVQHYPGGDLLRANPRQVQVPVAGGPRRSRVSDHRTPQERLLNRCPGGATRRWSGARRCRRPPPCSQITAGGASRTASGFATPSNVNCASGPAPSTSTRPIRPPPTSPNT